MSLAAAAAAAAAAVIGALSTTDDDLACTAADARCALLLRRRRRRRPRRRRRMIFLLPAASLLWVLLPACNLVVSRSVTDACRMQYVRLQPLSSSRNGKFASGTLGMWPCLAWAPFSRLGDMTPPAAGCSSECFSHLLQSAHCAALVLHALLHVTALMQLPHQLATWPQHANG